MVGIMSIFRHFMLWPFFIGLVIGLFMVYFHVDLPVDRVAKWPHPTNVNALVFKDKNNLCFRFETDMVDCGSVTAKNYPYEV